MRPCAGRQLITFLSVEARRAGKLRGKLASVEMWTRQHRISETLVRRIRAYYAEVWLPYVGAPCTTAPNSLRSTPSLPCLKCLGLLRKAPCHLLSS